MISCSALGLFIAVIWIHFIADFVFQCDKMALNKSKSIPWLSAHCAIYGLCFIVFGWAVALCAGLSHYVIDFFTSRANAALWKANERHWFFTMIGFDQALHLTVLAWFIRYVM